MKKCFYLLVLNYFCFFPLFVQAVDVPTVCKGFFNKLFKRETDVTVKSNQISPSLLKEINDPGLSIKSVVRVTDEQYFGAHYFGNEIVFPTISPGKQRGQIKYLSVYIPSKSYVSKDEKEKGQFVVLFRINSDTNMHQVYEHWIHWPSHAKDSHLSEDLVKEIFDKIYRETYGESLEWVIKSQVIFKAITYGIENKLDQFDLYDIFNFDSLLYRNNQDRFRQLVVEVINHPEQIGSTSEKREISQIPSNSNKMGPEMRRLLLRSYTIEELKALPLEDIIALPSEDMKALPSEDIMALRFIDVIELFNTSEKIQILDMSWFSSELAIKLLMESPLWRASITHTQVRQLDVSGEGIQYIFVPTFKYYVWRPEPQNSKFKIIGIDTLSDEQIISLDRDTFLRDVFLAGDLFTEGLLPLEVQHFWMLHKGKVKELGFDTVMKGSLPKEMHNFILKKLGFNVDFEFMTPKQRRELFKKEIEMMTNISQQITMITDIVEENKRGNHNWF